jgi:hypothetical protein
VKKQINSSIKAHFLRSALILLSFLAVCAIPFALAQSRSRGINNSLRQNIVSDAPFQPSTATHETRTAWQGAPEFPNATEVTPRIETVSSAPPTRSSFMAMWDSASGVKGYLLDVSTNNSFSSYVDGYHDLDVGNVNGRAITGLNPATTYYYRVRPYTDAGSGGYSNIMTATTAVPTGLIINPTFDDSILNDPGSAAIQAMIHRAIAIYESLFSDPITIQILFRYSDSAPNGDALPPDVLSISNSAIYTVSWNNFISHLRADARTGNDNTANASLPGSALSANIAPSSANGRAVGLNTPPAMFPDGTFGQGGPFDGIVTLNSAQPFWFTRPLISGSFDAQRSVEHEIDEVIGLGSYLNSVPACPSYEAESIPPNTVTGSATPVPCTTCSEGRKVAYVGNNSGTLQFNNVTANVPGSNVITIWYLNGDAERHALLSVNGSSGIPLSFPSTGSFETVGSIQTTIPLNPGSNNSLTFYNPIEGNWAPDFDRIVVNCNIPPSANLRPQDLFSWSSPGVRNRSLNGSRYFSINSGNTNIVGFNQTPPGDFGDWLSEGCPQSHPYVQNAFVCPNQFSDISATSPEGINLDVIGYDLGSGPPPAQTDFNNDRKPDYLLYNTGTRQTAVWYLNNNVRIGGSYAPTLPVGWSVIDAADFNRDGRPDYALFNASTRQTGIWYLSGVTFIGSAAGPTLPVGWALVATGDFNNDGKPDYVLFNAGTRQTAIWYLNNNVRIGGAYGPSIPVPWTLAGIADFNRDGKPDYLLFNPNTLYSVVWYLSGTSRIGAAFGPTIAAGYTLAGASDFNRDGKPDYLLFNSSTRGTVLWYLNNNVRIGSAVAPTLPVGWTLAAP